MIQSSSSSNSSSFRSDVSSPGQPIGAPSSSSKAGQFKTLFQIIEDEECCRMLQGWIESRGKSTITNEMERFISDCQGLNGFPALFHAFLHSQIQLFLAPTRSLSTTAINDSSSSTHLSSISLGTSASGGATQTSAEDIGTIAKKSDDHAVPLTLGGLPITVRKTQQQSKAKKRVNPIAVLAAPIVASVQTSQSASQKESHPSAPTSGNISSLPSSSPIGTNPTTAPSATLDSETPDCPAGLDRLASVYARLVMQQYLPLTANVLLLAKMLAVATEDSPLSRSITNSSSLPLFANTNFSRMPSFIHSSFHLHAFAVRAIESLKPLIHCLGPNLMQGLSDNTAIRHHNPAFASELTAVCEEVTGVGKEEALIVPSVFIRTFREDVDSRHEYKSTYECAAYNERERCFDDFSNLLHSYLDISRHDLDGSSSRDFFKRMLPVAGTRLLALKDCNYLWFADIFTRMLLFYAWQSLAAESQSARKSTGGISNGGSTLIVKAAHSSAVATGRQGNGDGLSAPTESPSTNSSSSPNLGSSSAPSTPLLDMQASRRTKLEARLGGTVPPPRAPYRGNVSGGTTYYTQTSNAGTMQSDVFDEPAVLFPGAAQFFYRFIIACDNRRFCSALEAVVSAEIMRLVEGGGTGDRLSTGQRRSSGTADSASQPSLSAPTAEILSFTHRIMRLRLLGKFLGVLTFYPTWSSLLYTSAGGQQTASSTNAASPISLSLSELQSLRGTLRPSLPLRQHLETAYASSQLCLVVPWISELLKMAVWDSFYRHDPPTFCYRDTLAYMKAISCSELFTPSSRGRLTPNRVYTLMEIQALLAHFPAPVDSTVVMNNRHQHSVTRRLALLPDEGNQAFSEAFCKHVVPTLEEACNVLKIKPKNGVVTASRVGVKSQRGMDHIMSAAAVGGNLSAASTSGTIPPPAPKQRVTPTVIQPFLSSSSSTGSLQSPQATRSSSIAPPTPPSKSLTPLSRTLSFGASDRISPQGSSKSQTQTSLSRAFSFSSSVPPTLGGNIGMASRPLPQASTPHSQQSFSPRSPDQPQNQSTEMYSYSVSDQLELSFWQQHGHLMAMRTFILDHCQQACHAHLRERIAGAVREFWEIVASVRGDFENPMVAAIVAQRLDPMATVKAPATDGRVPAVSTICSENGHKSTQKSGTFTMDAYTAELEIRLARLHDQTVEEGSIFCEEFLSNRFAATLQELCSLYPGHVRVKSLAMALIKHTARDKCTMLVEFLSGYAKRKLRDVLALSVRQLTKAVTEGAEVGAPSRLSRISSTTTALEQVSIAAKSQPLMQASMRPSPAVESGLAVLSIALTTLPEGIFYVKRAYASGPLEGIASSDYVEVSSPAGAEMFLKYPCLVQCCACIGPLSSGLQSTAAPLQSQSAFNENKETALSPIEATQSRCSTIILNYDSSSNRNKISMLFHCLHRVILGVAMTTSGVHAPHDGHGNESVSEGNDDTAGGKNCAASITFSTSACLNSDQLLASFIHAIRPPRSKVDPIDLATASCTPEALAAPGVANIGSIHGRLSIDLAKFFIQCFPSLLQMDGHLTLSTWKLDAIDADNTDTDKSSLSIAISETRPSVLLLTTHKLGLMTAQAVSRVLLSSSRSSTLSFYASCHGMNYLKTKSGENENDLAAQQDASGSKTIKVQSMLLRVIGKFVAQCGIAPTASSLASPSTEAISTSADVEGCARDSNEWHADPSVRYLVKGALGIDLAALVSKLSRDVR